LQLKLDPNSQSFTGLGILRNGNFVFTNFIYEKLLSHDALVTGRVTATSSNQTQLFKQL